MHDLDRLRRACVVLAHSKGAQVLAIALDELRPAKLVALTASGPPPVARFNQIILAAPDIRASDFGSPILPAVSSHHRVTNHVASDDEALRLSKVVNSVGRAGDSRNGPSLVAGVETIDVTAVDGGMLGHSRFGDSPVVMADIRLQFPDARRTRADSNGHGRVSGS